MTSESWRWRRERDDSWSFFGSSEFEAFIAHRHQPYSARNREGVVDRLLVTLQSGSLRAVDKELADRAELLLAYAVQHSDLISLTRTPGALSPGITDELLEMTESLTYGELRDTSYGRVQDIQVGESRYTTIPARDEESLSLRLRCSGVPERSLRAMSKLWSDLEAHTALDNNVFVTENPTLLRYRRIAWSEANVWVVNIAEFFDFFDRWCKGSERYLYRPSFRTDRFGYYLERMQRSIPNSIGFAAAVRKAVEDGLLDEAIFGYILSIQSRLRYMIEARDRIGYLYYTTVGMDATDAALYHLNYFLLLTTAVFDNCAWVLNLYFGLNFDKYDTDLWDKKFRKALDSPLQALISKYRRVMRAFYEPRHSIAHRTLMWGVGLKERRTGGGCNLAVIDEMFAKWVRGFDRSSSSGPYSTWGMAEVGGIFVLEPYRFTTAALESITSFANDLFGVLSSEGKVREEGADERSLRREQRREFVIPMFGPIV